MSEEEPIHVYNICIYICIYIYMYIYIYSHSKWCFNKGIPKSPSFRFRNSPHLPRYKCIYVYIQHPSTTQLLTAMNIAPIFSSEKHGGKPFSSPRLCSRCCCGQVEGGIGSVAKNWEFWEGENKFLRQK